MMLWNRTNCRSKKLNIKANNGTNNKVLNTHTLLLYLYPSRVSALTLRLIWSTILLLWWWNTWSHNHYWQVSKVKETMCSCVHIQHYILLGVLAWPKMKANGSEKCPDLTVMFFYMKNMLTALTLPSKQNKYVKACILSSQSLLVSLMTLCHVSVLTMEKCFLHICIPHVLHMWQPWTWTTWVEFVSFWSLYYNHHVVITESTALFYRGAFSHIFCLKQGTLPTCCSMWFCGMLHSDRRRYLRG